MNPGRRAKSLIKTGVKTFVGLPGLAPRSHPPCARILTYHSIGHRDHEMNVTPEAFREQMAWLADHGPVIPLDAAAEGVSGVALTFDDGYLDNLTQAAPVLGRYGFPATVFMVAGRAGAVLPHDTDPATSTLMSWEELRRIEEAGWTVGAHSLTHCRLSTLTEPQQRSEIEGSRRLLEEKLGHAVTAFAYPYGSAADYNEASIRLVKESGYRYAVSNRYGVTTNVSPRWALRRIWIDATDSLAFFRAKITGRLDSLTMLDSPGAIRLRKLLNSALKG
ncbi:MAG: polysaccharide deacetylase family protein [Candidatus Hydrogenedentes bacterium]|nr:polysaccharide deacetylase family protein [Candidatus Hydrogenedentota bacterium]